MWLETLVWVWAPIACAAAAWTVWRTAATTREIRTLRARVAALEAQNDSLKRRAHAA